MPCFPSSLHYSKYFVQAQPGLDNAAASGREAYNIFLKKSASEETLFKNDIVSVVV